MARASERTHELVALVGRALTLHYGNYNRFRQQADAAAPTMVISFLGDTEVGKSTTIRALMGEDEERPFVQRGAMAAPPGAPWMQTSSTTFNVNLYPCRSLLHGSTVNFLDFEGENGSETPVMSGVEAGTAYSTGYARATAQVLGISSLGAVSSSPLVRAEVVREFFPRLAYCASDVVVLIGTEPFYSTRYLERALAFAKRANAGVQDVELPVLLLISNKRDADETEMNIEASTRLFQSRMGGDLALLDSYFSCIVCCQLPNVKTSRTGPDGTVFPGSVLFEEQLTKIKTLLVSLLRARMLERETRLTQGGGPGRRVITSRAGLWFALLPKIIDTLNSNEPVYVSRLVDAAWAESMSHIMRDEAPMDVFKSMVTHIRPSPSLSSHAPRLYEDMLVRFAQFCSTASSLAVRMVATRMRRMESSFLFEDRVEAASRPQLEFAMKLLSDIVPCCAVYGGGHNSITLGRPVERPDEPVLCMQEARTHAKTHRGSRCVRGGGSTLWQRLLSLTPYNPTWEGPYEPALVDLPDMRTLLNDVLDQVFCSADDFLAYLLRFQYVHSSKSATITFAPLEPVPDAAVALPNSSLGVAVHGDDDADMDAALVLPSWAFQLRPDFHRDACTFPYCTACGQRVAHAVRTSSGATAVETSAAITPVETAAADFSYAEWLSAAMEEILSSVSHEASRLVGWDKHSTARTVTFAGHEEPARASAAAPHLSRPRKGVLKRASMSPATATHRATHPETEASVPSQQVVLGLCAQCWLLVRAFDARRHAARRAAATIAGGYNAGASASPSAPDGATTAQADPHSVATALKF